MSHMGNSHILGETVTLIIILLQVKLLIFFFLMLEEISRVAEIDSKDLLVYKTIEQLGLMNHKSVLWWWTSIHKTRKLRVLCLSTGPYYRKRRLGLIAPQKTFYYTVNRTVLNLKNILAPSVVDPTSNRCSNFFL